MSNSAMASVHTGTQSSTLQLPLPMNTLAQSTQSSTIQLPLPMNALAQGTLPSTLQLPLPMNALAQSAQPSTLQLPLPMNTLAQSTQSSTMQPMPNSTSTTTSAHTGTQSQTLPLPMNNAVALVQLVHAHDSSIINANQIGLLNCSPQLQTGTYSHGSSHSTVISSLPFELKFLTPAIKICTGCQKGYEMSAEAKNCVPPNNLCLVHKEQIYITM